jgi:hypothetical protein
MKRDKLGTERLLYYFLILITCGLAFVLRIIVTIGVKEYFKQKEKEDNSANNQNVDEKIMSAIVEAKGSSKIK